MLALIYNGCEIKKSHRHIMALIGYHASHEQFRPGELLSYASMAEQAGFMAINCSDHFHPWSERQGQSGFAFSWLGAALQSTSLPCGVVCSPGQRYHPAIVAQAVATLADMFPERFWIALGSGEAINERITGKRWPSKQERNARLLECADIIRRLLDGETVTHRGLVCVEEAKLYTRPKEKPLMIGAAVTTETAAWVGSWADGLITINKPIRELEETVRAFRGGEGKNKPMFLKVQLSYARTEEEALSGAYDQWRTNIFSGKVLGDLATVEQFDALGDLVQPSQMKDVVNISSNLRQHVQWIKQYIDRGFERIILHNVNRDQKTFIKAFGEEVLPELREASFSTVAPQSR
jgi:coenzyme F420-dependent glucose-6-phosphate dehydrogenase